MKYPNLIFDLYGTLVSIHTDEEKPIVWEQLARFYGYHGAHYAPEELHSAYHAMLDARNAKAGQNYEGYPDLPIEPILTELFSAKGIRAEKQPVTAAAQMLRIAETEYICLYPGVSEALRSLREQGFRLYLLSNAQAAFTRAELELLQLTDCFDAVYLSSDFGVRKPDRRFFEALLKGEQLQPEQCLMIGNDMNTDLAGARSAGIADLYLKTDMAISGPGTPAYRIEGQEWSSIWRAVAKIAE